MTAGSPLPDASARRLREVPWRALEPVADALDAPLAQVLDGADTAAVVRRTLRAHPTLGVEGRRALAEALFGVALWRRRLAWHAGLAVLAPRAVLALLVRDLGGVEDAAALLGLAATALPAARPPPDDLADRYSLPDWLARELRRAAPDDAPALADALGLPAPVAFRANPLRTTPGALARRLAGEGIALRPGALVSDALLATSPRPNVYGSAAWQEGLFEVQDEGSQLVGSLLEAGPGDAVLDLCAGAGGKSLQLAGAVGPAGTVHAADPDGERLERLALRAARAGASDVVRIHGAAPPPGLRVGRVLVDAPCSALGPLRRGPDQRFRVDPATFAPLPELQRTILERGVAHLAPGGRLVYATCTFRREENEEVALRLERAHPALRRVRGRAPACCLGPDGFVRTWPHRHGCDGFFAAVWDLAR